MAFSSGQIVLLCAVGIILLARPAHAFGAGNIGSTSKIEGQNWRHGDLEDTLLTIVASKAMGGKKFSKLDVKRVYFGNWLRDYSQAVDVGTVKSVSAEAIRILLWVLGFMSFGYGSGSFEVTTERLGCYRPEEHIDNPKDYADNQDARQYDRRLRGPVDERRELAIDPDTGLKNYIASERMGIDTSAALVRKLFGGCIELGRRYARNKNKADLHEALRLLGTGCHCLEDYSAHSNYVELALIEMGERDIFPHVGRRTAVRIRGARNEVYPLVTGTFGGVDFLHSVCGEFDDKATQSEIEELENTMTQAQNGRQDGSILQSLLSKVPKGIFGGKDQAGEAQNLQQNAAAHQMQNTRISPRQPEEWTRYLNDVQAQLLPIIQWHDEVMQSITETIENIPILPTLIDSIQEEINKFVFALIAPYVVPIIKQVKNELNTGSSEIIQSSKDKQLIVFHDDNSSDPTHSMLSKDHFSNILNEPAGKVASQTVKWVVPQLVAAWDDERIDIDRTLDRIIHGVLHHPAQRDQGEDGASDGRRLMFGVVEKWWHDKDEREKSSLRDQLSRRGVESGRNHKEGVQDHGHGSARPLGMANLHQSQSSFPAAQAVSAIGNTIDELTGTGQSNNRPSGYSAGYQGTGQSGTGDSIGKYASEAVGGGVLGAIVGGIAGNVGADMLGGGLDENKQTFKRQSYGQDGSRTETVTQIGQSGDRYGQAQYSQTYEPGGGRREEYKRFEQRQSGGHLTSEVRTEQRTSSGEYHEDTRRFGTETSGYGRDDDRTEGHGRRHETSYGGNASNEYGRREEKRQSGGGYGRRNDDDDNDNSGGYGRRTQDQHESSGGYSRREERSEYSSGGTGGYGESRHERREDHSSGGGGFGGGRRRDDDDDNTYGSSGYGRQQRGDDDNDNNNQYGRTAGQGQGYGRNEDNEYGSRRHEGGSAGGYGGNESSGHGRAHGRRNDDDDNNFGSRRTEETYDVPGSFGEDDGNYGRRKEGRKDDDDETEGYGSRRNRRSGGGDEYGGGGYSRY